ncbi:hypothetical protein L3Q82_002529 [Scortum barcoo]|uniref:Uncharacterized protein n=1 Tax=Scortum barcoo TaxID=214431 RepID=A0ACB8VYX3_9TELE|nr:hypothetical protein L3Q82_002529 [Scortum barcoo]
MEKYIRESLAAGLIQPSKAPLGAGFFFVEKKTLYAYYRGLNNITIRNKYPLPLIDSAFTPLQGAVIFTKLDLHFAYHLEHQSHVRQVLQRVLENRLYFKKEKCEFHTSRVSFLGFIIERGQIQADPEKVRAVAEWPVPTSRKLLQRFLGFANFYRRFIRNYSQVAAPLTALTSPAHVFQWGPRS